MERILRMVDSVLLLVDAADGPMPQTRFVLRKALDIGLQPIVVINKIDRNGARPHQVHDEIFDLFIELTPAMRSSIFPPSSVRQAGHRHHGPGHDSDNLVPLFEAIMRKCRRRR